MLATTLEAEARLKELCEQQAQLLTRDNNVQTIGLTPYRGGVKLKIPSPPDLIGNKRDERKKNAFTVRGGRDIYFGETRTSYEVADQDSCVVDKAITAYAKLSSLKRLSAKDKAIWGLILQESTVCAFEAKRLL